MDLAFGPPGWAALTGQEKARSQLSDDFCKIVYADGQIDRFIRTVLPIPVPDADDEFCFGVWVSISEKSWDAYLAGFEDGIHAIDNCFGYLMHNLPDMPDTWHMHVTVEFQPGKQRPRIFLNQTDHPLVIAQANGVSMDQVERWVAPAMQH